MQLNSVEHALSMYAESYALLPAEFIYQNERIAEHKAVIDQCHIYLIGAVPSVDITDICERNGVVTTIISCLSNDYYLDWPIPEGMDYVQEDDTYYFKDEKGNKFEIPDEVIMKRFFDESDPKNRSFHIQYIGQAFGNDGKRNALERLKSHETLQKIALTGLPQGYRLQILMLDIKDATQLITVFNSNAHNHDNSSERINSGLKKLFETDEQERVTLYEASLIRYFMPKFNTEFKNSFPSTRLKLLKDCYEKDMLAVIAEINIDELPYRLCSNKIGPQSYHIAKHDLHDDESRKAFFML